MLLLFCMFVCCLSQGILDRNYLRGLKDENARQLKDQFVKYNTYRILSGVLESAKKGNTLYTHYHLDYECREMLIQDCDEVYRMLKFNLHRQLPDSDIKFLTEKTILIKVEVSWA